MFAADEMKALIETFSAEAYVVALGIYSPLLTRPIGLDLPIYPTKGYSATVDIVDESKAPTVSVTEAAWHLSQGWLLVHSLSETVAERWVSHRAQQLGVTAYVTKPFNLVGLVELAAAVGILVPCPSDWFRVSRISCLIPGRADRRGRAQRSGRGHGRRAAGTPAGRRRRP